MMHVASAQQFYAKVQTQKNPLYVHKGQGKRFIAELS